MSAASTSSSMFRSLRVRNYRIYFFGQLASMSGSVVQTVATAWLVLELTGDGTVVGAVIALQFVVLLIFGPYAGVVVDRMSRRKAVIAAELFLATQAAILTVLVATDSITLWMLYALAIMQGLGNAFEIPSRQSLLGELVTNDDLPNALALNGTLFTMARIVGPAIAGGLIVVVGMAQCFALNALSYVVVAFAVFLIRPQEMHHRRQVVAEPGQLRDGIRAGFGRTLPRLLMTGSFVNGIYLGGASAVLYSLLARYTFDGTAATYGVMGTVSGIGAAVAAVWLTRKTDISVTLIAVVAGGAGLATIATGLAPTLAVEYFTLLFAGGFTLAQAVSGLAKLQLVSDPQYRGRVIALYFSANAAGAALSGITMGALAQATDPRVALVVSGTAGVALCARWLVYLRVEARGGAAESLRHGEGLMLDTEPGHAS